MCGPKFCSYKITQDIMDNPEKIAAIAQLATKNSTNGQANWVAS
jgi:phosphomethylpyrimidine synthase